MRKEPTHKCKKCGQMKYKFEFHQGYNVCRECRHKMYLKHRKRIIERTAQNLKKRLKIDAQFREQYTHKQIAVVHELNCRTSAMNLQLFMFNINYVL